MMFDDHVEPIFWSNAALIWVILVVPHVARSFNSPGSKHWWPLGVAVVVLAVAVFVGRLQPRKWEERIREKLGSLRLKFVGHDEPPLEELSGRAYEEVERRARETEMVTCLVLTSFLVVELFFLMTRPERVNF